LLPKYGRLSKSKEHYNTGAGFPPSAKALGFHPVDTMNPLEDNKPHPDLTDFEGAYTSTCECGKTHTIFSQKESFYCEYNQYVWVECEICKKLAKFQISVN
jgi:hypothetical protein